uniref:phosphoribosylformimino-5-aminoimidazole carboxamide ribotide isomerase n=1 Tax=Candidatus Electrothrix sp. TaxID=2170559 RepID=UPI0040565BAA
MRFRPCIDLHNGKVKQIVGSTLSDSDSATLQTNFSSQFSPAHYAQMYRQDNLPGGHVIMLGPGNEEAATEALQAWPGGLQVGGGITDQNAEQWLERGASHVIVTSHVFHDGQLDTKRLDKLCQLIGKEQLVLDLSCRWKHNGYYVVTDRWQKFTDLKINKALLLELEKSCDEFLIHAVDVEGKCMGVDEVLLELLAAAEVNKAITYAGGVTHLKDLERICQAGKSQLDATVGSALDIFGGTGCTYEEVVKFHKKAAE